MEFLVLASAFVLITLAQSVVFLYVVRALLVRLAELSRFLQASADVNAYVTTCGPEESEAPPEMSAEEIEQRVAEGRPAF